MKYVRSRSNIVETWLHSDLFFCNFLGCDCNETSKDRFSFENKLKKEHKLKQTMFSTTFISSESQEKNKEKLSIKQKQPKNYERYSAVTLLKTSVLFNEISLSAEDFAQRPFLFSHKNIQLRISS